MSGKKTTAVLSGYSAPGSGSDLLLAALDEDGKLELLYEHRLGTNPSCLCLGEDGLLYAGSELEDGAAVTAFDLSDGALRPVAEYRAPGTGLCHLLASPRGIFGCCYGSGSVFLLSYTGELLWQSPSVLGGHAHFSVRGRDGALWWADLGQDALLRIPLENGIPRGAEERYPMPRGTGPRQLLALDNGETAVINECSGSISFLSGFGREDRIQTVRATGAQRENYPGGACLMRDGTLLAANRGADTIAAFQNGKQGWFRAGEWPAGGSWPRWLCPHKQVLLACCQHTGAVCSHYWDGNRLHPADTLALSGASCAVILPDRQSG